MQKKTTQSSDNCFDEADDNPTGLQAVILATGETNKLDPLTKTIPSPMVPVANQPVMMYAIELLARHGIEEVYVCVNHLAASIESYFMEGYRWGVELQYILQRDILGTGGSVKLAQPWLTDSFIVLPADVVFDLDIAAALAKHRATGSVATVIHSADNANMGNGAVILEREALDYIPARTKFDIIRDLLPRLEDAQLTVTYHVTRTTFSSLESFHDYHQAQTTFLRDRSNLQHLSLPTREIAQGIWSGRRTIIAPDAKLTPPVLIGQNCHIGRGVELGPNVVIGNDVFIDDEATISETTVLNGTYVGRLVHLRERVVTGNLVIDVASGEHVKIEDEFILSFYKRAVALSLRRVFDMTAASVLLMFLLPLMLILGLMARLTTGRALRRVDCASSSGQDSHYTLWRFNTRSEGANNWFGQWMEAWDLHRLPELWNVVSGDLNFVGAKPLLADEVMGLSDEAWGAERDDLAPGFTGLWYVETDRSAGLLEALIADAYYMATRSWLLDMKIIARTPGSWFR